jgi:hypothetical protein
MLLIVIAALCTALIVQQRRAARREIGLEAELAQLRLVLARSDLRVKAVDDERARLLKIVQEITRKLVDLEVAANRSEANSRSEVSGEDAASRPLKRDESENELRINASQHPRRV